ncbi:MAG: spore coat protein [Butyrivibrio sp.]|nr:spore coat protein [Ruminococcus flavefaciens]MCM1559162.1 spore coat protein [Butyrivibrio sp.]
MLGIILQARMGSSRLPGKILKDIGGKALLKHIDDRITLLKHKVTFVIATSDLPQDDAVEEFCRQNNIDCFRGSESNVLKRYYDCAKAYRFDNIIRMTGDNPFPDIEELDNLIAYHVQQNLDFSENFSVLPIGVGMEIMSFGALEKSVQGASLEKHFEHADEYILDNLDKFSHATVQVSADKNYPDVRLTVDTSEDYRKACYIVEKARGKYVTTQLAIELAREFEKKGGDAA